MRLQTLIPLLPPPCLLRSGKAAFYFYGLEMIIGLTHCCRLRKRLQRAIVANLERTLSNRADNDFQCRR